MIRGRDDSWLIEACRAGHVEAFGELVGRYQDRLYPTALRLTGREDDARDLLQDAFLKAFQKLGRFRGESAFYTWIYRITVNLALSGRRGRRVAPATGLAPIDPPDPAPESDPALPLQRAEQDALVQSALDALGPEHRAVVVMKEFDGLRYEQIAAILGVPVGTVRSRLHRARSELRIRLQSLVDEDAVPAPTLRHRDAWHEPPTATFGPSPPDHHEPSR